jgi:hypothetical protein
MLICVLCTLELQANLRVPCWNSKAYSIEIKEFKQILDHSSRYKVFSPSCEICGSLKGKLLYATKENTELK